MDLVRQEEGYRGREGATLIANHGTSVLLACACMGLSKGQSAGCVCSRHFWSVQMPLLGRTARRKNCFAKRIQAVHGQPPDQLHLV